MSTSMLYRLSGLALLLALPIQLLGWLLHPRGEELADLLSATQGPAHVIQFVSWIFVLLGLPGLYARQARRAGVLGLGSFVLVSLAAAYHCYLLLYEAYPARLLAHRSATQGLAVTGGPLAHGAGALGSFADLVVVLAFPLFGIAALRAGVLPRPTGWLSIASVPVFLLGLMLLPSRLPGPASPIAVLYYLLFLGFAWGGYALWQGEAAATELATTSVIPRPAI